MSKKEEIPHIFYLHIHSKLSRLTEGDIITEKELRKNMYHWNIPQSIRPLMIKEMELLGLIERVNRFIIKFNKSEFQLDNLTKYYQKLKVY